jgi:exonuclease III
VRLLAWNILHGGGSRLARIVDGVSAYDDDVIALTEFRGRPGVVLCAAMKDRGLGYVETTHPLGNQNGIAVFSRTPMRCTRPSLAPSTSRRGVSHEVAERNLWPRDRRRVWQSRGALG